MHTGSSHTGTPDVDPLDVVTLSDALGLGLAMAEEFGGEPDGEFCAMWLGDDAGRMLDFVVCTERAERDLDAVVPCAAIAVSMLGAERVVLWTTDDDLTDGPRLAHDYFLHRDLLADTGAVLVDEIVIGDDELRSMAITTFTDEPGWDDVSDRLAVGSGGDDR